MENKNSMLVKSFTIMILTVLCFFACKKDHLSQKSAYASFSKWSKTMAPPKQKFTVNLTTGGTIVGDHGYQFYFAPGSLMDQSFQPITGNVEVTLTEVTSVTEMIGSGAGTKAYDGILGSAGMFNLTLKKGGQDVYINPNKPVKAQVMADPNADMSGVTIFKGYQVPDTFSDTSVYWYPKKDSVKTQINWDSFKRVYDSIAKVYKEKRCLKFDLNFSGWCNLDAYYNSPSGAEIVVKAEGTASNFETRVFMYLNQNNLKGFYELYPDNSQKEQYSSQNYNLPIGWTMKIIVVTRTESKELKYEARTITNASSTVHTFNSLKTVSDDDLETFFKSL